MAEAETTTACSVGSGLSMDHGEKRFQICTGARSFSQNLIEQKTRPLRILVVGIMHNPWVTQRGGVTGALFFLTPFPHIQLPGNVGIDRELSVFLAPQNQLAKRFLWISDASLPQHGRDPEASDVEASRDRSGGDCLRSGVLL